MEPICSHQAVYLHLCLLKTPADQAGWPSGWPAGSESSITRVSLRSEAAAPFLSP